MKEKCAFCNGSKVELVDGLGVPCVWCDPVGTAIADDKLERDGVTAAPVAATVPPAGDVEGLPERYDESQYRGTSLLAVRRWNKCLDAVTPLFTRLTAERDEEALWRKEAREGWRQATKVIEMQRVKLDEQEAELTKARELIDRALTDVGKSMSTGVREDLEDFLAHQSAPVAKGER